MIELTFLQDYAALFILLIAFILIYAAVTKLKVPGSEVTLAILSILISLILVSSTKAVKYLFSLIPFLTLIMIITFVILVLLMFTAKEIDTFRKPLAIVSFVLAILLVLGFAFSQFTILNHMLPGTTNSGLDSSLSQFKNWIYSSDVLNTILFVGAVFLVGYFMLKKVGK